MRATLADASLTRYAGRFVWLELDFDKPANQDFIRSHGVVYTPTLFIVDPRNGRATATNMGGLTLLELQKFLDRGENDAIGERAFNLVAAKRYEEAARLAATEAPRMRRDEAFARVVLAGIEAVNGGATTQRPIIEPLAVEALNVPGVLRDHRFQLYQELMVTASSRGDKGGMQRYGDRWLAEIDAAKPKSDDERSALDIARVDAAGILEQPERVIPALVASEHAMPDNYNASLRLAQMLLAAKRYDEAIAACDRGLSHVTGPLGRSWLLRTKADAFAGKRDGANARAALRDALAAARQIGVPSLRDRNVAFLTKRVRELGN